MYLIEVTFTNLLKKVVRVEHLEDALIFINDFEKCDPTSTISVKTINGIFSIMKCSIFSVEMKECD